jgi:hypothetical protein
MSRNGKISLIIDGREIKSGLVHLSVRMLNSTLSQPTTNELPVILHAISNSSYANVNANDRFTYTFPFPLAQGWGFPYVLDMQFEDDGMLTLA